MIVQPQAAAVARATLAEHCSERQREALPKEELVVMGRYHIRYHILPYSATAAIVSRDPVIPGLIRWKALVGTRMGWLPAADCMLAAKLLLEADEQAFVRAGNKCGNIWLD